MNICTFIGRLTRDPELKFLPNSGMAVVNFTMAVKRDIKKDGQPEADFINFIAFQKRAETIAEYVKKGNQLAVNGRLQIRSYDRDGSKVFVSEILVNDFQFLESKKENKKEESFNPDNYGEYGQYNNSDDDCPF